MAMKKLTPVLFVKSIEEALPFWTERLKFTKTVDVPGENGLGFCILQHGDVEVMLQTQESLREDLPQLAAAELSATGVMLFLELEDLDEVLKAIEGCEIVVPERTTFYHMREIAVRAPGGCVIIFAQKVGEQSD